MSANLYVKKVLAQNNLWPFTDDQFDEILVPRAAAEITAAWARPNGISLCYGFNEAPLPNRGGVAIAFRKANNYKNCRMVEVAVSYCSPQDTFSKKIGGAQATKNFLEGNTIMVPVRDKQDDTIVPALIRTFWFNYDLITK